MIKVPKDAIPWLKLMLSQLQDNRLEVNLVEPKEVKHVGHQLRAVTGQNPEWYREFCSRHTKQRTDKRKRQGHQHHDTKIKRGNVIQILEKMMRCHSTKSIYVTELIELAYDLKDKEEDARNEYEAKYGKASGGFEEALQRGTDDAF